MKSNFFALGCGLFLIASLQMPQPAIAQESNGCGPVGYGALIPDGPFSSACDSHDICYGNSGIDQATCDQRFKDDMYAICQQRYSGPKVESCKSLADYYVGAVSTFGETFISLEGQKISGEIVSVQARRIDAFFGDDEFEACVTFKNNGTINTEYDLQLYSASGKLIDTEPDTYEVNLKVGESTRECVGTQGIFPSISDLGNQYRVVLRVDAPQQSLFANLLNDFITVDWHKASTP